MSPSRFALAMLTAALEVPSREQAALWVTCVNKVALESTCINRTDLAITNLTWVALAIINPTRVALAMSFTERVVLRRSVLGIVCMIRAAGGWLERLGKGLIGEEVGYKMVVDRVGTSAPGLNSPVLLGEQS